MATRSISLRIDEETLAQIDRYAAVQDRSRNWWINEAMAAALEAEKYWEAEIDRRIASFDESSSIPHDQVMAEMRKRYVKP